MDALKSKGQMYDQINLEQIPRSGFDLSYSVRGTGKLGRLIPIRNMETQPGDSIKGSTQIALQFEPLAVPMLSSMRVKTEHWYVPFNTLWKDWDKFITKGQDLSDDSSVPTINFKEVFNLVSSLFFTSALQFPVRVGVFDVSEKQDKSNVIAGVFVQQKTMRDVLGNLYNQYIRSQKPAVGVISYARTYQVDDLFDYVKPLIDQMLSVVNNADTVKLEYGSTDLYIPLSKSLIVDTPKYVSPNLRKDVVTGGTSSSRPSGTYMHRNSDGSFEVRSWNNTYDYTTVFGKEVCSYDDKYMGYMSDLDLQLKDVYYGSDAFLPSDFLNAFIQFLYDLIAPVCGLGSNLDYLGYQKMLPVDFQRFFLDFMYTQISQLFGILNSGQVVNETHTFSFFYKYESWANSVNALITQSLPQIVLPLRAFYSIWWNNYRDQLLETVAPEPITESIVTDTELFLLLVPRQRAWSKDTFTTALANTGTGSIVVPVGSKFAADTATEYDITGVDAEAAQLQDMGLHNIELSDGKVIDLPTRYLSQFHSSSSSSSVTTQGFSLDMLRRAGRAEKWIQKALIYGNRIQDALFTHWRVTIKNERLQLPEFISSSTQLVRMDTILNNTTTSESVAGDKAGFASAYDNGVNFDEYSPEIGVIISIMSVMPEQSYASGSPRFLSKVKIFDYAFPEFAQIGMDAVYKSELVSTPMRAAVDITEVFGYQGRYYDYKCKQDEDHGQLLTTQDMYTFARRFNPYSETGVPQLNYRFIHCFPRLDMFVVDDVNADQFRYDVHHSVACSRALPVCGMSV